MTARPTYLLTLEADGRRDDAATVRKLRALLKRLGRVYGFTCRKVEELPADDATAAIAAGSSIPRTTRTPRPRPQKTSIRDATLPPARREAVQLTINRA